MHFDIFTILAASFLVFLAAGLISLYFWKRNRSAVWLGWWSAGLATIGLAIALMMARPVLPAFIYAGVRVSVMLVGFGLIWQAMRVFERRRPVLWPVAAAALGWLIVYLVPEVRNSLLLRMLIQLMPMIAFLGLAAFELWRGRAEELASRLPMIGVLGMVALIFAVRIPLLPFAPFPMGAQDPNPTIVAAFLSVMFIAGIAMTMLFISMTLERQEREHRALAFCDPLTGLLNRRGLEAAVRSSDVSEMTATILFDLDHFKYINDMFGHAAGDEILRRFTRVCRENIRQVDYAARIGGEEFVLVLPDTNADAALSVADRVRKVFAESVVDTAAGAVACTVSAGVSMDRGKPEDVMLALLDKADADLYRAKRAGRNRVFMEGLEHVA